MFKLLLIIVFIILKTNYCIGISVKSSKLCSNPYSCLSFVTQTDCNPDEYLDINYENGCCPTCEKGLRK